MTTRPKLAFALFGFLASCRIADVSLPDLGPLPIADVIVYTWPGLVQVDDTLRISAEGFDSLGFGFVKDAPFAWSTRDSLKTITLEQTPSRYAYTHDILVRGKAVGKATVTAVANKITGTGTVEVIPRISRIDISPSSATIAVGDSLQFTATVITVAGDTLRGYSPLWRTIPEYSSVFVYFSGRVRGVSVGTTQLTATLAGAVGKAQITVVAHSP
jgi:hypothetical protein